MTDEQNKVAAERAARQAAQAEVAELKERIARAGVEQRRAVREAVLQEREECALVCEIRAGSASLLASSRDAKTHAAAAKSFAAAIRARPWPPQTPAPRQASANP